MPNAHQVRRTGGELGEEFPVERLHLGGQALQARGQHPEAEVVRRPPAGHTLHLRQKLAPDGGKLLA